MSTESARNLRRQLQTPVDGNYVLFDFETTGTRTPDDQIVEIGAVRCTADGQVLDSFSTLIKPTCYMSVRASQITGITDYMLRGKPKLKEVLPQFLAFIGDLPLVGHGIKGFDLRFLDAACQQVGLPCITNDYLDTNSFCRKVFRPEETGGKWSVETFVRLFGLRQRNAHRALNDVLMENDVYQVLRNRYLERGPVVSESTQKAVDLFHAALYDTKGLVVTVPSTRPVRNERKEERLFAKPSSEKQKCGLVAHIEPKSVVIEICGYIPELRDYVRTTPFIHWKNNGGIWQLQIDAPIGENLLSFTNAMATINQPVSVMEKTGASPISVY